MKTKSKKGFKTIGWLGVFACGLCCALPILGAAVGMGSLVAIAAYLEKAGLILLIVSAISFVVYFIRKRKEKKECGTMCSTDCTCKSENLNEKVSILSKNQ